MNVQGQLWYTRHSHAAAGALQRVDLRDRFEVGFVHCGVEERRVADSLVFRPIVEASPHPAGSGGTPPNKAPDRYRIDFLDILENFRLFEATPARTISCSSLWKARGTRGCVAGKLMISKGTLDAQVR